MIIVDKHASTYDDNGNPTYDDNGNLTFDGNFKYTYDAWNRLVKATLDDTDVTIHEAAFDGLGRRVVKTVSNSGDLDGVTEYYHNRNQIIETRDGSGNLETQVYHGTQYIDEVVGQRIAAMGRVYVHQDANYNVTGTTDLTARQIERNYYSPYGQLEVAVDSHPFDYDDDGDVDADDYAVTTNGTCAGTATADCRRMDADADGDVDSTDQTTINDYIATLSTDMELARVPAATESRRGNRFGHQGLAFTADVDAYSVRTRWFSPRIKMFSQRDQLALKPIGKSGFQDGQNLTSLVRSNPLRWRDAFGLSTCKGQSDPGVPGWIECHNGEGAPCAREVGWDPYPGDNSDWTDLQEAISDCFLAEESCHVQDVNRWNLCDFKCDGEEPDPSDPQFYETECRCRPNTVACFANILGWCDATPDPQLCEIMLKNNIGMICISFDLYSCPENKPSECSDPSVSPLVTP